MSHERIFPRLHLFVTHIGDNLRRCCPLLMRFFALVHIEKATWPVACRIVFAVPRRGVVDILVGVEIR